MARCSGNPTAYLKMAGASEHMDLFSDNCPVSVCMDFKDDWKR